MPIDRGMPDAVVEGSNEIMVVGGEPRQGTNVAISKDEFEQYRLGYRCRVCHGVQSVPFPEVCETKDVTGSGWRCGYRMRDMQLADLERHHRGERRYGPSEVDADYEQEAWRPRSGIWLPRGVG